MPDFEYALVNAFSRSPFGGNPALIVFLDSDSVSELPSDEVCKEIAATFNQPVACFVSTSATAFHAYYSTQNASSEISTTRSSKVLHTHIRSWSPGFVELPICGHGTLAATFALYERLRLSAAAARATGAAPESIDFETHKCGTISARRHTVRTNPNSSSAVETRAPDSDSESEKEKEEVSPESESPQSLIEIDLPLFTPVRAFDAETIRLSAILSRAVRRSGLTKTGLKKLTHTHTQVRDNDEDRDGLPPYCEHEVKVRNVIVAAEAAVNVHARFPCLIEVDESEDIENMIFDTGIFVRVFSSVSTISSSYSNKTK